MLNGAALTFFKCSPFVTPEGFANNRKAGLMRPRSLLIISEYYNYKSGSGVRYLQEHPSG